MSDDRIQLPNFLIADFYKHSLVELDNYIDKTTEANKEKLAPPSEELSRNISYLGSNDKKVIVVVKDEGSENLNKTDLTFLTNILKACQLSINDIAIINISTQNITFSEIKEQLSPATLLLFDVEPSFIKLPFTIPAFQVQNYSGCTIVLAPPLTLLNQASPESRLLKTKLWNSLKQVFNIS